MATIDRYLVREISKPLATTLGVLIAIFASYTAAEYLLDAANGLLAGSTVAALVLLKIVIGLEVLIPITLYLSVITALGRLYSDSEMTALAASGVSEGRLLRAVFRLSLTLALLVAGLSLIVRPWAYATSYRMRAQAREELDIGRFDPGRFYQLDDRVVFAEQVDRGSRRAEQVFIQREDGNRLQVVYARAARQQTEEETGDQVLVLVDGHAYDLSRTGGSSRMLRFERYAVPLQDKAPETRYRRKAAPTSVLARARSGEERAEFQWRLSTPFSTVLLGLLAFPLSRSAPRRGKYAKIVAAVLVFALYYNLTVAARAWVEQDAVPTWLGLWWVHALLGVVVATLLWRPQGLPRAAPRLPGRRRRGGRR